MTLSFGNTIKNLRIKRGLSQEKLAEHLGVAPQSISKWERNEGYPDITFLIPLAEFFDVTLDTLMGRDESKKELKIQNILSQIEHCRHTGDHETKNKLIKEAFKEFPYDFRIVSWYTVVLSDVENITENQREIEHLCEYILDECTEDKHRYEAISVLIDLYSRLGDYETAKLYTDRLPDMNYSKEFLMCNIYPEGDERDFHAMAEFIDRAMENLLWFSCQIAGQRTELTNAERIEILERMCTAAEAIYPDFDHCGCHSVMADIYLSLYRYHSEEGRVSAALDALDLCFKHEKALDETEDSVVEHTSVLLRGHSFDMRTGWNGGKCNGVYWVLERLSDPRFTFDCYREDVRFYAILNKYRPYAVEDKTKT